MHFEFEGEKYSFRFRYERTEKSVQIKASGRDIWLADHGQSIKVIKASGRDIWLVDHGQSMQVMQKLTNRPDTTMVVELKRFTWKALCILSQWDGAEWKVLMWHSARLSRLDQLKRTTGRDMALGRYKKDGPFLSDVGRNALFYAAMQKAWHGRFARAKASGGV